MLREIAQTPDEDVDAFQDTSKHRYFNANTIWLNLPRLKETLDAQDGVLGLPMIVNRKTVDPGDKSSPDVIQLETAMGAAIDVFDGAQALHVPRERFIPVKTTNDLLVVRSDAYELDDDFKLVLRTRRGTRAARRPRRRALQARRRLRGALPARPAVARRSAEPVGQGRRDVRPRRGVPRRRRRRGRQATIDDRRGPRGLPLGHVAAPLGVPARDGVDLACRRAAGAGAGPRGA